MAYQSGGGGTISDLVNAIRDFSIAQGWTNSGQGSLSSGGYLYLSKGICKVSMQWDNTHTETSYQTPGSSTTTSVHNDRILAFVNDAFSTGVTTWFGHGTAYPGGTQEYQGMASCVADLYGPLGAWYLFSNSTGDYIHVAVQTTSDRFSHFSFGLVDKGSMTHSGAAYVTGTNNVWWPDNQASDPSSGQLTYNKPVNHLAPFMGNSVRGNIGRGSTLYIPNALPGDMPVCGCSFALSGQASCDPYSTLAMQNTPLLFPMNAPGGLLDHVISASAPAWAGVTPMMGLPAILGKHDASKFCAVGLYPDVRLTNLDGVDPGQELTLGSDTWKVFPILRKAPWSDSGVAFKPSSGLYGIAYKKIP